MVSAWLDAGPFSQRLLAFQFPIGLFSYVNGCCIKKDKKLGVPSSKMYEFPPLPLFFQSPNNPSQGQFGDTHGVDQEIGAHPNQ